MRRLATIIIIFFSCFMLAGCEGEDRADSGDKNAGISAQAVSAQAVETDIIKEECCHQNCYHTDTNLYREAPGMKYDIVQMKLDGTGKKKYRVEDFRELLGISGGYLYYEAYEGNGDYLPEYIYRIPIEKDQNGQDVLKVEKRERLITEYASIWGIYVGETYLWYQCEGSGLVAKYDLQNKRFKSTAQVFPDGEDAEVEFIRCGDTVLACVSYLDEPTEVYAQKMEEDTWEKIGICTRLFYDSLRDYSEDAVFYMSDPSYLAERMPGTIRMIDLTEGKNRVFIQKKELRKAVVQAAKLHNPKDEIDVCAVTALFYQEGRLYVQVQLSFRRNNVYHIRYLLFSQGREEDDSSLRHEKELTKLLTTYGTVEKGQWVESWYVPGMDWREEEVIEKDVRRNVAKCYRMINGKAFLWFPDKKKKKGRVGCYELANGRFRWLTKKDEEYYEPCQDVLHDRSIHFGTDSMYQPGDSTEIIEENWGPDGRTHKRGGFHEKK